MWLETDCGFRVEPSAMGQATGRTGEGSNLMLSKQILIDLCTQRDFLSPEGAVPVSELDTLLPNLRRIIIWAKRNRVSIVSALDAHRRHENFTLLPPHCIDGTTGQKKLDFTMLRKQAMVEIDCTPGVPIGILRRHQQVIFRKRTKDFMSNPKVERLLTEMKKVEFIIVGVGAEHGVKVLALGLAARQKRVAVITDACGYWNKAEADLAFRQIEAKGAVLLTTAELMERHEKMGQQTGILTEEAPKKRRRAARPRLGFPRSLA